jgi:DNA polymerase I
VSKFLEWQKMHKLLTTYLRRFPQVVREGRIHSQWKQTGTRTGRLSSVDINLQNIPVRGERGKLIRGLFVAPKDMPFLMGDFSQLETRIMAHLSQDPELLRIFRDKEDPFIALGSRIYGKQLTKESPERGATKNVWYANGYGALPPKMWRMITLDGVEMALSEVEALWNELQKLLPVYFEYRDELIGKAKADGYVTTIGGRKRRIRFTKGMTWKEETHGERAAGNAKFQGSAHDIMRRTMIGYRRPALRLCAQVHDELIYQYVSNKVNPLQWEHDALLLQDQAENGHGYDLSVPLVFEVKVATSWADK